MFLSHSHHHDTNVADGKRLEAKPAAITRPDGGRIPAIAVFSGFSLKFCIPLEDALRVADAIVDAAEHYDAA